MHDVYSLPINVMVTTETGFRWAGHVGRMGTISYAKHLVEVFAKYMAGLGQSVRSWKITVT